MLESISSIMRVELDFLVIGSGVAGLMFALKAAKHGRVGIVTKATVDEGATRYAQGGIASVFDEKDSFESHIQDTLEAGAGLCDPRIVELTVREGPDRMRELIDLGVPFTKRGSINGTSDEAAPTGAKGEEYHLTREGGHRARRILHASDFTGQAVEETLLKSVRANPNIKIYENHIAIDLITNESCDRAQTVMHRKSSGEARQRDKTEKSASATEAPSTSAATSAASQPKLSCLGAYVLDSRHGPIHTFSARATVLATGGAGKVYLYTTNPNTATGDGIAMAHRAGARIANMEFMQFHPTCLFSPKAKSFLISEALRGEGGELVNDQGEPFMKNHHPMGSLAPRDIVARAIDSEMKRSGAECVYLDMTKLDKEFLKQRFPNIYERCLQYGIDLTAQPIPVVPAAHYTCGGVYTDEWGESSIDNLYAIGEVAFTGLHGANRLASNSLLEGVVFADRAYRRAFEKRKRAPSDAKAGHLPAHLPEWDSGMAVAMEERININHTWRELRTLMWNYVGIVRMDSRLHKAQARLELIEHDVEEYYWTYLLNPDLIELRNLVTIARLIVDSALMRKESRGLNYNLDYSSTDDRFFRRPTVL